MNLTSLGRIIWARRLIVLIAMLSSLLGGFAMILTTAKRYDATNRVQLDLIKPDPITGFKVTSKNAVPYVNSQIQEITDFQVAGRAAEDLGWLDNSDLQTMYAQLPPGTGYDFAHWVAQRISESTSVRPIEDSNIIEIKYRAISPEVARVVAEAIRKAYVEDMSATQAQLAQASLPRFKQLAAQAQAKLSELENEKGALEKETGIILQDNNIDMDSSRLQSMAVTSTPATVVPTTNERENQLKLQLAQLDMMIGEASKTIGPNNPQLQALHQRRDLAASQLAQMAPISAEAAAATTEIGRQQAERMSTQTAKVISQGAKVTQLRLLQDAINAQHTRYDNAATRASQAQLMLNGGGGNVTPVGVTDGPDNAVYPNNALVLGGSGGLGLILGLIIAFLVELSSRRVRTELDLRLISSESGVSVLPTIKMEKAARRRRQLGRLKVVAG